MKTICRFLVLLVVFSPILASGQTADIKPIPKDSSYTPYQTWLKIKRDFPQATIVTDQLPEGIMAEYNIVYATLPLTTFGKRELHLDLFKPEKTGTYPALLLIHGGGWRSGNRTMQIPLAQIIAAKGYVTAAVEYRLSPEALYPAAIHDIKAAVRFLRANAAKYSIDPNRIAITGSSAGGQLAALIGMTPDVKKFDGNEGNPRVSAEIQAIIDMDGILDFTDPNESAKDTDPSKPSAGAYWFGATFKQSPEKWKEASPILYAGKKTPPILFINSALPRFHAGRDSVINILKKHGIYSEVHTIPYTPHPFWLFHPWFEPTVNYMVTFLDKILKVPQDKPDFTVSPDGKGDFTSIQKAIDACKAFPDKRVTIFVKNGIYKEKLVIPSCNTFLSILGESAEHTIITFDDHFAKINRGRNSTFYTYTLKVEANDFVLGNITVENSAGPVGQALALDVEGDRCVFYNCRFLGNQDTMYAAGMFSRQYFSNCYIEGTTDFIFGEATVLFEKCVLHSKGDSFITAASTPEGKPFGFVFNECKLTAADGVTKVFLGRPWRAFAKVAYLNCEMGSFIKPEGWNNWSKAENEKTANYAEYNNSGPGAHTDQRVSWSLKLTKMEAACYTKEQIFAPSAWEAVAKKKWYNYDNEL
jgi:pectin methylesterase-like acyl-CoA thioesterase/acetyl esterase/lipase